MQHQGLATILLIEDDKLMREMMRDHLQKNSFIVIEALSLKRGMDIITQHKLDAILLDLNLGHETSLPSIPDFKAQQNIPVLVVSGESDDKKKILTFELGADDFIEKPFNPELLTARLRSHIGKAGTDKKRKNAELAFGQWRLDASQMQAVNENGQSASLTLSEFTVLKHLVKHAGHVIKRETLCETLKKQNYVPTTRAIDIKITRIRKKLEQPADTLSPIKTIRGVGYVFDSTLIKET